MIVSPADYNLTVTTDVNNGTVPVGNVSYSYTNDFVSGTDYTDGTNGTSYSYSYDYDNMTDGVSYSYSGSSYSFNNSKNGWSYYYSVGSSDVFTSYDPVNGDIHYSYMYSDSDKWYLSYSYGNLDVFTSYDSINGDVHYSYSYLPNYSTYYSAWSYYYT